ncbi:hypothetical protein A4A49_60185 [Nicotiana attenuata]|uniref:Uncharacterized protein n=1 Tax=Nicotiana attenuata TaxID=49451 RepID=A0A314KXJ2_NICAT|nr:hypothetical protein A4A49_60185 [Nicotiana attenuata]
MDEAPPHALDIQLEYLLNQDIPPDFLDEIPPNLEEILPNNVGVNNLEVGQEGIIGNLNGLAGNNEVNQNKEVPVEAPPPPPHALDIQLEYLLKQDIPPDFLDDIPPNLEKILPNNVGVNNIEVGQEEIIGNLNGLDGNNEVNQNEEVPVEAPPPPPPHALDIQLEYLLKQDILPDFLDDIPPNLEKILPNNVGVNNLEVGQEGILGNLNGLGGNNEGNQNEEVPVNFLDEIPPNLEEILPNNVDVNNHEVGQEGIIGNLNGLGGNNKVSQNEEVPVESPPPPPPHALDIQLEYLLKQDISPDFLDDIPPNIEKILPNNVGVNNLEVGQEGIIGNLNGLGENNEGNQNEEVQ